MRINNNNKKKWPLSQDDIQESQENTVSKRREWPVVKIAAGRSSKVRLEK